MLNFQLQTLFLLVACAALMALGWRIADFAFEDGPYAYHLPVSIAAMMVVLTHGSWRVAPIAIVGVAIGTTMFLVPIFQLPYAMAAEERLVASYIIGSAGCSIGAVFGAGYLWYRDTKRTGEHSRIARAVPWLCLFASLVTTGLHLRHFSMLVQAVME
jgi:hypothetical protein